MKKFARTFAILLLLGCGSATKVQVPANVEDVLESPLPDITEGLPEAGELISFEVGGGFGTGFVVSSTVDIVDHVKPFSVDCHFLQKDGHFLSKISNIRTPPTKTVGFRVPQYGGFTIGTQIRQHATDKQPERKGILKAIYSNGSGLIQWEAGNWSTYPLPASEQKVP